MEGRAASLGPRRRLGRHGVYDATGDRCRCRSALASRPTCSSSAPAPRRRVSNCRAARPTRSEARRPAPPPWRPRHPGSGRCHRLHSRGRAARPLSASSPSTPAAVPPSSARWRSARTVTPSRRVGRAGTQEHVVQAASDAAPQQRPALGLPWPATAQEPPVGPDRYNGQPSLQLQLHLQLQLQRRCPLRPRLRLQPLPRLRRWRRHRGGRGLRQRPAVRAAPRPLRSHPPSLSSRSQGIQGGSASAVFSAARFLFPFESLSYTIYKYGIGALLPRPTRVDLTCYLAHAAHHYRFTRQWPDTRHVRGLCVRIEAASGTSLPRLAPVAAHHGLTVGPPARTRSSGRARWVVNVTDVRNTN